MYPILSNLIQLLQNVFKCIYTFPNVSNCFKIGISYIVPVALQKKQTVKSTMPIFSSATTTSDFNLTEPSVTKSINEIGKRSYSNQKRRSLLQPSPSVQIKKKSSLFFFNLRLDSFLTQSNKEQKNQSNNLDQKQELHSSYLQLLRGQSKSINK